LSVQAFIAQATGKAFNLAVLHGWRKNRQLAKGVEKIAETSITCLKVTIIQLMIRRMAVWKLVFLVRIASKWSS
jgi:hypothetical protein